MTWKQTEDLGAVYTLNIVQDLYQEGSNFQHFSAPKVNFILEYVTNCFQTI